jgi:nucleotide-binding universal stress UspA family protein
MGWTTVSLRCHRTSTRPHGSLGETVMAAERSPRIVVGVSTSLAGLAALRLAVEEARRRGIGHIAAMRSWPDASRGRSAPWAADVIRICLKTVDAAATAVFGGTPMGVGIEALAPRGRPGPELVRFVTDERDMIIVGTRRRYLPGNGVGGYCARHAPCPVVIVPPPSMIGRGHTHRLTRSLRRDLDNAETLR